MYDGTKLNVDDFIVMVGKKQSNSIYHIHSVKSSSIDKNLVRNRVLVYVSDLLSLIRRDSTQRLIVASWYN
jgi:hypothetical protein